MDLEKIKQKVARYGWEEGFGLEEYHIDWLIEQAEKVEQYEKELEQKNCPICGNNIDDHDRYKLEECCLVKLENEMGDDYIG